MAQESQRLQDPLTGGGHVSYRTADGASPQSELARRITEPKSYAYRVATFDFESPETFRRLDPEEMIMLERIQQATSLSEEMDLIQQLQDDLAEEVPVHKSNCTPRKCPFPDPEPEVRIRL